MQQLIGQFSLNAYDPSGIEKYTVGRWMKLITTVKNR
jgi:hypothetical protein